MEIERRGGVYFIHEKPLHDILGGLLNECMDGDMVIVSGEEKNLKVVEIVERRHGRFPTLLRYNPETQSYEAPLHPLYKPKTPNYDNPPKYMLVFPQPRLSLSEHPSMDVVYSWNSHEWARTACQLWYSTIRFPENISVEREFSRTRDAMKKLTEEAVDLTSLPGTFVIDPPGCEDADDAVTVDVDNKKIYVHITLLHDLSPVEYSRHLTRGFTLYLPGSEGKNDTTHLLKDLRHSLTVSPDRKLTMTSCFTFTGEEITGYESYPAWITVKSSHTYLDSPRGIIYHPWVAKVISKYRKPHVSVPVLDLHMSQDCKVVKGHRLVQNDDYGHEFISTLMILTNIYSCDTLRQRIPRRLHMIDRVIEDEESFSGLSTVEKILKLKSYRKANYSASTSGHHWALREMNYTHSTSPMRRHFDLLVHRSYKCPDSIDEAILRYLNDREVMIRFLVICYKKWKIAEYLRGEKVRVVVTITFPGGCYWYCPEWALEGKSVLNWRKGPKVGDYIMVNIDSDC
jgi:hypothetical protein